MGALKNYAGEVSVALGFKGELNERVIDVASRAMGPVGKLPSEKRNSDDPEFIDLVNRIDHEMMDGDDD